MMNTKIAIVAGVRTPFCKAGGRMKHLEVDDLGAFVVSELLARSPLQQEEIDEVIFGNVIQPPSLANVARIIAVKGGVPESVPAYSVNRNCASGMEAVVSAASVIERGEGSILIAGGAESMTHFPILFKRRAREFFIQFSKCKTWKQKAALLATLRPKDLMPEMPRIADPLCGLSMGQTAEILSREFLISREEQDRFALESQQRAAKARREGFFADEIVSIPVGEHFAEIQSDDDGIREDQTLEALSALKPIFDPLTGTVTAGTSSQITDGAVALLLMSAAEAEKRGLTPLGYLTGHTRAALDPSRMGLGPIFAISRLLRQLQLKIEDFDLIEINEAFAAQVLAVMRAGESAAFSKKFLHSDSPVGRIERDKLNVNGGAIALGHPLGASGARLILTLLLELRRRGLRRGIASLCVGGGQGQAVAVEVKP